MPFKGLIEFNSFGMNHAQCIGQYVHHTFYYLAPSSIHSFNWQLWKIILICTLS